MNPLIQLNSDFEGQPLTTVTCKGRSAWVARQVGAVLGYANGGKRLPNKIAGDWAGEFIEGHDYLVLRGEDLAAFKELTKDSPVAVSSRVNRGLLILFESGLHLVLAKTNKPVGKRLRRFLVDDVIPQLVRDGRYDPERKVEGEGFVRVEVSATTTQVGDVRLERERRLARKLELDDRRFRTRSLHLTLDTLAGLGQIDADVRAAYEVSACEIALGEQLPALRATVEDGWLSPTEIAKRFGVSAQKVGRVITRLDLRGNKPGLARAILNKARGSNRTVITYLYSPEAVIRIETTLGQHG